MKPRTWSVVLTALSVGFALYAAVERRSFATVWGDESTYLAMAESLALDGDLWFTEADAARLRAGDRGTVILQRTERGVAYSKPVLYALLAAPAVLVARDLGPVLLNLACLLAAAWLAWRFLRRVGDGERAALTVVTFVGASVLLAHVGWRMSDLLQAALALGGLVLALACLRLPAGVTPGRLDGRAAAVLAGVLFGLLVACRLPNALIVLVALAALVVGGRPRRALRVVLAAAVVLAALGLASSFAIGAVDPYKAVRSTFNAETGYPVAGDELALARFDDHRRTQSMRLTPIWRADVSAYSTLYFFVGRHSGLLWYFPALLALALAAGRRPDRVTLCLWLGVGLLSAFYLIWWPDNYFGGASFLGNRYFLPVYPLALVALPVLPGRRGLALSWAVALTMGASAAASFAVAPEAAGSQSHALAGLPRWLPYESTGRAIDGRRDRYWAGDFLRFVDSRGRVGPDTFTLESGERPAEILLVTRDRSSPILLRYKTRAASATLVVGDRDGERRYELDRGATVRRGALAVPLASAWRRHRFWWNWYDPYFARSVRLALVGDDEGGPATFWYGGSPAALDESFAYTGPGLELPAAAVAGGSSTFQVRVRNMSPVPWSRGGAFPVTLSCRLESLADAAAPPVEGRRVELPADLPSGDPVHLELAVAWPAEPGRYRLTVDLLIEDYAWFETRLGRPLASGEVEVAPAGPPEP